MTRTWTPGAPDADLSRIARTPRLLVALDFDGTVSELGDDPLAVRAVPASAVQIDRLAAMPDTVVAYVSGRTMHSLRLISEHTDDSPIALAGSHGAQYWYPGTGHEDAGADVSAEELAALQEAVGEIVARHEGVTYEVKTYGMGVHTRRVDDDVQRAVFAEVDALVAERAPHWRRRPGHRVLEFSARIEGKDTAIAALRARFGTTGVFFAGDDVTDEDALGSLGEEDLGVRVGDGETAATLRVADPAEVALLLTALADERAAGRE